MLYDSWWKRNGMLELKSFSFLPSSCRVLFLLPLTESTLRKSWGCGGEEEFMVSIGKHSPPSSSFPSSYSSPMAASSLHHISALVLPSPNVAQLLSLPGSLTLSCSCKLCPILSVVKSHSQTSLVWQLSLILSMAWD